MGETTGTEKAPKKSFFKGLKAEFNKIIWPDKDTVGKQTVAVIVCSVAFGFCGGYRCAGNYHRNPGFHYQMGPQLHYLIKARVIRCQKQSGM